MKYFSCVIISRNGFYLDRGTDSLSKHLLINKKKVKENVFEGL